MMVNSFSDRDYGVSKCDTGKQRLLKHSKAVSRLDSNHLCVNYNSPALLLNLNIHILRTWQSAVRALEVSWLVFVSTRVFNV